MNQNYGGTASSGVVSFSGGLSSELKPNTLHETLDQLNGLLSDILRDARAIKTAVRGHEISIKNDTACIAPIDLDGKAKDLITMAYALQDVVRQTAKAVGHDVREEGF